MISGRILATIINEAYFTLQDKVSSKEEIDEAMRLGIRLSLFTDPFAQMGEKDWFSICF